MSQSISTSSHRTDFSSSWLLKADNLSQLQFRTAGELESLLIDSWNKAQLETEKVVVGSFRAQSWAGRPHTILVLNR